MVALLLVSAGCGKADAAGGVSDSLFVATMAELRAVSGNRTLDSASVATQRAAVLRKRGLTAEQLQRAAHALADDPDHASKVWQAIAKKGDPTAVRP